MIKAYYMLTKPGIIFGNLVTMFAGFFLASKGSFNLGILIWSLIGLALVIAGAGAFNSFIDRAADAKMARTKNRPLVTGKISEGKALFFGTILSFLGLTALYSINFSTALVTFLGFFTYVVLYAFWKYRSFYGTLVGSVAGAVPPVVGYCAVANQLDTAALLLFVTVLLWQMPHFFAIAIFRLKEYTAAAIPVLPLVKGIEATKKQMLIYIVAFTAAALSLTFMGYAGYTYFFIALLLGFSWLILGILGLNSTNNIRWARQMFTYSLVVIMTLCVTLSIDSSFQKKTTTEITENEIRANSLSL